MIKMIFSDIDGTLLNSKHQVSKQTKLKIQEVDKKGIPFVLVSARMPKGIYPIQKELGISDPIICYGGGLIIGSHHQVLHSEGFTIDQALKIKQTIHQLQEMICCSIYSNNHWYVDTVDDYWIKQEYEIAGTSPKDIAVLTIEEKIVHKILCMGKPKDIQYIKDILQQTYPSISIYKSKDTYLEIMPNTVSKSKAITLLCKKYDISLSDTISFGDNFNDIDMLQTTGLGYLMGNAHEELKKQIPMQAPDNDHDGIVEILNILEI